MVQLASWTRWFKQVNRIPERDDLYRLSRGDIFKTTPFQRWVAKQMLLIYDVHEILPLERYNIWLFHGCQYGCNWLAVSSSRMIAADLKGNYQHVYNWITGRGTGVDWEGNAIRPPFHAEWTVPILESSLMESAISWYDRMMLSEKWVRYWTKLTGTPPDARDTGLFFFWRCMAFARFDRMVEQGQTPDVDMLYRNSIAFALGSETTYAGNIRITRSPHLYVQPGRTLIRNYKSIAEEIVSDLVPPAVNF